MARPFRVACIQNTPARNIPDNLPAVINAVHQARDGGADLIVTPESVLMIEPKGRLLRQKVRTESEHEGLAAFTDLARETGAWILIGSLFIRPEKDQPAEDGRFANRSYLLTPKGEVAATYDKVHMFDVDVGDGQHYWESKTFRSGSRAVVADLPWGRLGLTICYDIRFPHLYRSLARAGASFLSIPAAFTKVTGRVHWETLVRARAIETGCFVFACGTVGRHAEGRETWGHSLIVSPWGEIVASAGDAPTVIWADVDPAQVAEARQRIPALRHDQVITGPSAPLSADPSA